MKRIKASIALVLLAGLGLAGSTLLAQDASTLKEAKQDVAQAKADQAIIEMQLPSYPLTTCPMSGEALEAPVDAVANGRLARLCCGKCAAKFKKNPTTTIDKIDKAVVKAQLASYPLKTCAVSGKDLGSMGEPINMVHGTRLVRLCCKGCVKKYEASPDMFVEAVNKELIKTQRASYPFERCLISDEPLDSPIDQLYGTTLVRFCCAGCVKEFRKDPVAVVAKVNLARADAAAKGKGAK
jgi:hypothetical protein